MCIIIIWHQHTRFLKMHGTGYWWHSDINDKLFEKNLLRCFTTLFSVHENFSLHSKHLFLCVQFISCLGISFWFQPCHKLDENHSLAISH